MKRKIIHIDRDKCNGCGECVPACAEGAIQIKNGKAELVDERYCDGLGDCLGECPQDAIRIEERKAEPFDPEAVEEHLKKSKEKATSTENSQPASCPSSGLGQTCPSSKMRNLASQSGGRAGNRPAENSAEESALEQWPVQLSLLPVEAPLYDSADLLLVADCVPFAFPGFHSRFLAEKTLLIGCPKLDNAREYSEKLARIIAQNDVRSLHTVHMQVPCCHGLARIAEEAVDSAKKDIPSKRTIIGINGEITAE